jgi:hypothetical protein
VTLRGRAEPSSALIKLQYGGKPSSSAECRNVSSESQREIEEHVARFTYVKSGESLRQKLLHREGLQVREAMKIK